MTQMKVYVAAHGRLRRDAFTVPPGVVLVFLTYPGACLYGGTVQHLLKTDKNVWNVVYGRKRKVYSVTYTAGMQAQDMNLSVLGLYAVPWQTAFQGRRGNVSRTKAMGVVPRSRNTRLSSLIRQIPRGPLGDLILFVGACRYTENTAIFNACKAKDELAGRQTGLRSPGQANKAAWSLLQRLRPKAQRVKYGRGWA